MPTRRYVALCLIAYLTGANSVMRAEPAPTTQVSDNASAAVEAIVKNTTLRLSTDENVGPKSFSCQLTITQEVNGGDRRTTVIQVRKMEEHSEVVAQSTDGLPYCIMSDKLLIGFDAIEKGTVVVFPEGAPVCELGGDDGGGAFLNLRFDRKAPRTVLDINLMSLLRNVQSRSTRARFTSDPNIIKVETKHSVVFLSTSPRKDNEPAKVERIDMLGPGTSIELSRIRTGEAAERPVAALSESRIRESGLRVRAVSTDDPGIIDLRVPVDFGRAAAERDAALTLRKAMSSETGAAPPSSGEVPVREQ